MEKRRPTPTPKPMPTSGLTRMLVFLGGALSGTLVEAALAAQHATEEPRGGGGNSTGDNHMGNETPQGLPLLLRPPPSVDRLAINKDKKTSNGRKTTPMPMLGLIKALAFLGVALISKLVGGALPARQAIPRSTPVEEARNSTRCVRENQSSVTLKLYYLQNGSARLGFWIKGREFLLPVRIVLKVFFSPRGGISLIWAGILSD
uniref:Uncharacterized protein n=1 Tax=Ananas comosus var. bracteatus TaxID=296719 RepID=A0A6V7PI69_ANACO|nr:unnamed protein product [Ananas comosus var. bracteatus]